MKPTATQILQRCKDIVGGKHAQPEFFDVFRIRDEGYAFYVKGTYILVHSLYISTLYSSYDFPAFLLGMDSEPAPAPEIVLEWEEDEYGRPSAKYNENVAGICFQIGILWFAYVEISGMQSLRMTPGQFDLEDAQQWCLDTIKSIVTQTPKQ